MSSHPGSVPLPRSIFHHPSLKRADRFQAYAWLLVEARWKTGSVTYRGRSIQLCRGEISITIRDFAKHLGWSSSTAWRFLADLEKKNLISLRKIKRLKGETAIETATDAAYETDFTVVTICNYGQFSESPLEDETATETDNDTAGETKKEEGGGKRIKKYKPQTPRVGFPVSIPIRLLVLPNRIADSTQPTHVHWEQTHASIARGFPIHRTSRRSGQRIHAAPARPVNRTYSRNGKC